MSDFQCSTRESGIVDIFFDLVISVDVENVYKIVGTLRDGRPKDTFGYDENDTKYPFESQNATKMFSSRG